MTKETSNKKRKMEAEVIFFHPLPFAHCANGHSSFVRLLTKKQTEVICVCKQTTVSGRYGLAHLCMLV